MRKVLDTVATILFTIAAIGISMLVAGVASYLSTMAICVVAEIFLDWEISQGLGTLITVLIAVVMLASFWGKLLHKKKQKKD